MLSAWRTFQAGSCNNPGEALDSHGCVCDSVIPLCHTGTNSVDHSSVTSHHHTCVTSHCYTLPIKQGLYGCISGRLAASSPPTPAHQHTYTPPLCIHNPNNLKTIPSGHVRPQHTLSLLCHLAPSHLTLSHLINQIRACTPASVAAWLPRIRTRRSRRRPYWAWQHSWLSWVTHSRQR